LVTYFIIWLGMLLVKTPSVDHFRDEGPPCALLVSAAHCIVRDT